MPRPIINFERENNNLNISSKNQSNFASFNLSDARIEKILRKKRPRALLDAIVSLDAGNQKITQNQIDKIKEIFKAEFPEVDLTGILLGIAGKCYLGEEYEVHTLTDNLQIINHYKTGEKMTPEMEVSRSLANNQHYAYIEIYTNCIRAVDKNGNVAVIKL